MARTKPTTRARARTAPEGDMIIKVGPTDVKPPSADEIKRMERNTRGLRKRVEQAAHNRDQSYI
jgi:hypothetical protein